MKLFNEDVNKLLNEGDLPKKRITKIFDMEFNIDNVFDLQKLVSLLDKYEELLKETKGKLQNELLFRKKARLVSCYHCLYAYREDETKNNYFCLKVREFIEHDTSDRVCCKSYKPIQ